MVVPCSHSATSRAELWSKGQTSTVCGAVWICQECFFGDEDDVDAEANHPVAFLAPCVTRRARHSLQAGWLAHTCLVLLPVFSKTPSNQAFPFSPAESREHGCNTAARPSFANSLSKISQGVPPRTRLTRGAPWQRRPKNIWEQAGIYRHEIDLFRSSERSVQWLTSCFIAQMPI